MGKARETKTQTQIDWLRIVELARQIDEDYRVRGAVNIDVAHRLVHGIVRFQEQMIGESMRALRRLPEVLRRDADRINQRSSR